MKLNKLINCTVSVLLIMSMLAGCNDAVNSKKNTISRISHETLYSFETTTQSNVDKSQINYIFPFLGEGPFSYDEPINCGTDKITHYEFYGFCDSEGNVLIDPIYKSAYFNGASYCVTRIDKDGNNYCGLIAADGSKSIEFDGNYFVRVDTNYIFYSIQNKNYEIYDNELNHLYTTKTISELIPDEDSESNKSPVFNSYYIKTDHYITNILTGESFEISKHINTRTTHSGGVVVLDLQDKSADVYSDEGLIISGDYVDSMYAFNGLIILQDEKKNCDVFDEFGTLLFSINCEHCYSVGNRLYAFDSRENPSTVWIYDLNGNLLDTKDASGLKAATMTYTEYYNDDYMYFFDTGLGNDLILDYDMNIVYECQDGDYKVMDNNNEMYVMNFYTDKIYKVSTGEMFEVSNLTNNNNAKVEWILNDTVLFAAYEEGNMHSTLVTFDNEILFTNDCRMPVY